MKILVLRLTTILGMVLFCMMPMANAAGPGGGGIGGGGADCGYISILEYCDASQDSERQTCQPEWGGSFDCTLVNCDGTQIQLNGPLTGC